MSYIFKALRKLIPPSKPKGLVGYDLEGNRYFELPNPMGGRLKRSVEYAVERDISEYSRADLKPPIQWRAWLAHTRPNPPTVQELQHDYQRQMNLLPKVAVIEAREREERIRQGYLLPDGSEPDTFKEIAGPSTSGERKAQAQRFTNAASKPHPATALNSEQAASSYPVPTPPSSQVSPPRRTVNQDTSAEGLRKLAEEDTKRRISESEGVPISNNDGVQSVQMGQGGLEPRRRGGAKKA